VEHATVALSTYLAVVKFNDGDISFLKIFEDLDIKPGSFTAQGCQDCDQSRIELSAKKSKETVKSRRKTLRHLRKNFVDEIEEKEGVVYEAGSFSHFLRYIDIKANFSIQFSHFCYFSGIIDLCDIIIL
jgi:hypothetical protein